MVLLLRGDQPFVEDGAAFVRGFALFDGQIIDMYGCAILDMENAVAVIACDCVMPVILGFECYFRGNAGQCGGEGNILGDDDVVPVFAG